jgi:hypothetical protein
MFIKIVSTVGSLPRPRNKQTNKQTNKHRFLLLHLRTTKSTCLFNRYFINWKANCPKDIAVSRTSKRETDEVKGVWRKLYNDELHNFYCSPNIFGSRDSSVSTVTRLRAERPLFHSRQGQGCFPLRHRVQICPRSHHSSYTIGTGGGVFPWE